MKLRYFHFGIAFITYLSFLLVELVYTSRAETAVAFNILSSVLIVICYFSLLEGLQRFITAKAVTGVIEKIFQRLITWGLIALMVLGINVWVVDMWSFSPLITNLSLGISIGGAIIYVCFAFVIFKKLVLLRGGKILRKLWKGLNIAINLCLLSMVLVNYLPPSVFDTIDAILLVFTILLSISIIPNNKWIAFIDRQTKISSLLYLPILILIVTGLYFISANAPMYGNVKAILLDNSFLKAIVFFFITYNIFSFSTIVFNWPLFASLDGQLQAVKDFQEVNQKAFKENDIHLLYVWLFDVATQATNSNATYLKVHDTKQARKIKHKSLNISSNIAYVLEKKMDWDRIDKRVQVFTEFEQNHHFSQYKSSLVICISYQQKQLAHIILFKDIDSGYDQYMLDLLNGYANQVQLVINDLESIKKSQITERLELELNNARRVQLSLFPTNFPNTEQYEVAGFSESATEIGGDYFDFIQVDENTLAVIIADVAGSGTSAALYMAQLKGVFQAMMRTRLPIEMFISSINEMLYEYIDSKYFITLTICIFDFQHQYVRYICAGHPPIIYAENAIANAYFLESNKNMAIGIAPNEIFTTDLAPNTATFQSGDVFVLFTDGITEAKSKNGELYGEERIRIGLGKYAKMPCEQIVAKLNNDVVEFADKLGKRDDKSLIAIKIK